MNSNKARLNSIYGVMLSKSGFNSVIVEDIKLKDIEELPLKGGTVCYFDTEFDDEGRINLIIRWKMHYDY